MKIQPRKWKCCKKQTKKKTTKKREREREKERKEKKRKDYKLMDQTNEVTTVL